MFLSDVVIYIVSAGNNVFMCLIYIAETHN